LAGPIGDDRPHARQFRDPGRPPALAALTCGCVPSPRRARRSCAWSLSRSRPAPASRDRPARDARRCLGSTNPRANPKARRRCWVFWWPRQDSNLQPAP